MVSFFMFLTKPASNTPSAFAMALLLSLSWSAPVQVQATLVDDAYRKGKEQLRARKPQPAIEALSRVIAVDPESAKAYRARGYAYTLAGEFKKAIGDYDNAVRLDPDCAWTYHARGSMYYALAFCKKPLELGYREYLPQAIEDYSKAIRLAPGKRCSYQMRSVAHELLGQYQQALEDKNKEVSLNPQEGDEYFLRAGLYEKHCEYQKAIDNYNECLQLKPNFAGGYYCRADVYEKLGRTDLASRDRRLAAEHGFVLGSAIAVEFPNKEEFPDE